MYITLFGTILSTSSAKGYERKETLGTIYIKEHEISKKIQLFTPFRQPKLQKMSAVVRGDVRLFFTHFSISTTFGHTLKRLFYYKVILKPIKFQSDDGKHQDRGCVIPFSCSSE